jgi:uncharacterized protein (TIGR03435 family)
MFGPMRLVVCTAAMMLGAQTLAVLAAQEPVPQAAPSPAAAAAPYTPGMTFEVASIHESKPDRDRGWIVGGGFEPDHSGRFSLQNNNLMNLLLWAYPVTSHQILGWDDLPKELKSAFFNVGAKVDPADEQRLATLPRKQVELEHQHMMQALLADRFNLKVHWEVRDSATYNLELVKSGKLRSTGAPLTAEEVKMFGNRPIPPIYQKGGSRGGFEYVAHGATVADLAETLTEQFGPPVNDRTGLSGKYDFDLKTYQTLDTDRQVEETNPWPPLETAIRDQLGLKLVHSHGPVKFLVIDHVEMPSPN